MPGDCLPVPHRKQLSDGMCLPACADMVLAHLGHDIKQQKLARILGTTELGTKSSNITRLTALDVSVEYEEGSATRLRHHLSRGVPCIVFLWTGHLFYWQVDTPHAVVVVGLAEETAYVNDPAFSDAPVRISLDELLLAWSEFEYRYAVVR